MARKTLNLVFPFEYFRRLPFRILSRSLLVGVTGLIILFIGWMMYHIYFQGHKGKPVASEPRNELFQASKVEDLELYKKNPDVPPVPSSIFPTSDISIIP